ncbi:MAG TPA: ATP-grasp domain-containing protein [Candidatus Saccharimonadales bacterium]|nr:ATP-grasp domain-containing protein [Candidatus Saccharimonadales bacterium]
MIKNPPIIKRVVREMGGKIEELIPRRGYFYIVLKGKKFLVSRKFKIASNLITGGETTKFKDLTYLLLNNKGIPTPKTISIHRKLLPNELHARLKTLKFPIIVKDAQGSQSKGIFANIADIKTAEKIIKREIKNFPRLIAQEMVKGDEYRITVLGNKLLGAVKLIPPRIIGNGKDSVRKLIEQKQKNARRKTPFDSSLNNTLAEQGFSLRSIPKKGTIVYIRRNSVLDEGGETEDATDQVHKKIKAMCTAAAMATGKYLAGIDVMCDDISKDPRKQNFNIIEINGKPDIYLHYNPTRGKTRNVVKDIVTFILKLKNIG